MLPYCHFLFSSSSLTTTLDNTSIKTSLRSTNGSHINMLRLLLRTPLRTSRRCFATYPTHEVVPLPALSPTMEMGGIARWSIKEGDAIAAGDIIVEIETDKATVDFEAQDDAFLAKILLTDGTSDVAVGTPMAVLVEEEADIAAFADYVPEAVVVDAAPTPRPAAADKMPAPVVVAAPTPVAIPTPVATPAPAGTIDATLTFEAYGNGVRSSALSESLLAAQEKYSEMYGSTLLESKGPSE